MTSQVSGAGYSGAEHEDSFYSQVRGMMDAFWASRQRNNLLMLTAALVLVVAATAYGQIRLNAWNRPFYDALAGKDMPVFFHQISVFAVLAGLLLVLNVGQMWLNQTTKIILRQGLVDDLLGEWLMPRRALRLIAAGEIGANPDQRIHEDARHLTELTTDLGIGLLQSTLLLISFIGVLWVLSRNVVITFADYQFSVPGYMVWCALIYALTASLASWIFGQPLIRLNAARYAREAELRFALVRVNEDIEGVSLYGGEADERRRLDVLFANVLEAARGVASRLTRLTWITAGYGWFALVAPILAAVPIYFQGNMTLGELMTVVGAFIQVQQALRWFVDNFSSIADWRATLLRVASFRRTMQNLDKTGGKQGRINLVEARDPSFRIQHLRISGSAVCVMLSEADVEFHPGQRVLIAGEIGTGKTLLFQSIAGLWPWGSGRITLPFGRDIMFMPTRAYVPPGVLRSAITYPHPASDYDTASIVKALNAVGLKRFEADLDKQDRWDRRLNEDEKQCVAFARVLLQKPKWVILDDVLDVLDSASRRRVEAIFNRDLAEVGVISLGHMKKGNQFYSRVLHIVSDPEGSTFKPAGRHGPVEETKLTNEFIPT